MDEWSTGGSKEIGGRGYLYIEDDVQIIEIVIPFKNGCVVIISVGLLFVG